MSKYGAADHEHGEQVPLASDGDQHHVEPMEYKSLSSFGASNIDETNQKRKKKIIVIAGATIAAACLIAINISVANSLNGRKPIGPYGLTSVQEGDSFFANYEFYDGPDSLGSAGYNNYVGKNRALELNIANITTESGPDVFASSDANAATRKEEQFIYMKSAPTEKGPRESVRLEGKTRYDRGLFILDLRHMPAGCGVWPAWWLTDEKHWPDNGEIDIVEGINYQTVAKTALHTSDRCNMFPHVPDWAKTGHWDWATGLPDTFTGVMDFNTSKPADDCNVLAPHQWANQGCVAVSSDEGTIGEPLNKQGGGIYALEWDPDKEKAIRSWVFPGHDSVPSNLREAIESASSTDKSKRVVPDPSEWGLPYAYFAVGEGTGCSADHLKNMRIVFNLAFCGTVAGNRYFRDCPAEAKLFKKGKDPVLSCNALIKSNPEMLEQAYWKIRGLYVYERAWMKPVPEESVGHD